MSERSILLVEDNPDEAELTLRALKRGQVADGVTLARDGVEALDYLLGTANDASQEPRRLPSLLLLDLKLPKVDGLEVLRRLRAHERTKLLPVVILTTSSEQRDLTQAYSLGANSFIVKPVEFEKLEAAVAQLGRYWLSLNEAPP